MAVSIGPGAESVGIDIYAADPLGARWDRVTWDGSYWTGLDWRPVGCDVGEVTYRWGAAQQDGILSLAQAGELDLGTIDPERELDPLNSSSPYYGYIRPGTPIRIVGVLDPLAQLVNGSFELAPALVGWTVSAPGAAEQSALTGAPDGAYTLRTIGNGVIGSPGVYQTLDVRPGTFRVSVAARVAAGAEARLRIHQLDGSGAIVGALATVTTTAPEFETLAAEFTVPAGVSRIRFDLYMPGVPAAGLAARFDAATFTRHGDAVATAYIDEASYDVASARGRIRAIDGIAYLAQAQLGAGVTLPNTLRARVRAIVAAVGLGAIVPVEPEAATDPDVDPPVAPSDLQSKPAWQAITDAALDALVYIWIDPTGLLRFRSFGSFPDASLSIGCPPADADPAELWILGLSTIESNGSADAVRNSIRAYSSGTTWAPAITDGVSLGKYGPRPLDIERVVPDRATWASRILADRSDAGLEIAVGTVRPYTDAELAALLDLQLAGPSVIRVRDDEHGELIDLDVSLLGSTIGITPAGWRFAFVTAISRIEWDNIEPEPPVPPEPPPGPTWHVETRTYVATSDALLALTSGGAKYGAGASSSLPVGVWDGWTYRACIKFPSIPWTGVRKLRSALLRVRTTDQVRVGFGSAPTIEIRRITEDWTAGSSSSPSSGNAVVYPGPSTTTTGAVRVHVTESEDAFEDAGLTAIARAWAPTSIGGSSAAQRGIMLLPGSGSTSDTTELWPVEKGGSSRPQITLELEIYD